jgi:hypothetical protein
MELWYKEEGNERGFKRGVNKEVESEKSNYILKNLWAIKILTCSPRAS